MQYAEIPEHDKYGRTAKRVFDRDKGPYSGIVAIITTLPKSWVTMYPEAGRYMVTDRREDRVYPPVYDETGMPPVFKTLKLAREHAASLFA